jgi:pimeloyl-ACP methyl ester carboxylesterase
VELVEVGGGRALAVERLGAADGPPLLYFHGLPGSRLDLVSVAPVVAAAGVRVLAVDRPGIGGSTRVPGRSLLDWPRDVEAVADRLGLERFAVVGYSSGGKFALACAYALPARITAAGVVSGTAPPNMPGFGGTVDAADRLSRFLAVRARPLALGLWGLVGELARRRPELLLAAFERSVTEPDREVLHDPAARAAFVDTLREALRHGPAGLVDDYAIEARSWGFALEAIRARVLVWHGDRDEAVPPRHGAWVAEAIPGAELRVLEGAGHLVHRELPSIVGELVSAA